MAFFLLATTTISFTLSTQRAAYIAELAGTVSLSQPLRPLYSFYGGRSFSSGRSKHTVSAKPLHSGTHTTQENTKYGREEP